MNKTTKVLLAIVFVAIAVILIIEGRSAFQKTGTQDQNASTDGQQQASQPANKPVISGIGDTMIKSAKLTIPAVANENSATLASLPANLAVLVQAGNTDLNVAKVSYAGGGNGYKITYKVGETEVKAFFQKFNQEVVQKGWISVMTAWSTTFGFFEVQDTSYEARVSMYPAEGKMAVVVEAVAK